MARRPARSRVSPDDLRVARDFLTHTGWTVREVSGGLLQLARKRGGPARQMSREAVVLFALRGLAERG